MKLTYNQQDLLDKVIKHWERMIEEVKKYNQGGTPSPNRLWSDIKETWFGDDCAFCDKYISTSCTKCPIYLLTGQQGDCTGTNWSEITHSDTWKDWLIEAEKFLDFLKAIPDSKIRLGGRG